MSAKTRGKGKIKMWIVLFIILVIIVVVLVGGLLFDAQRRREINELTINAVDFKKLRDGIYVGEYIGTKSHFSDTRVQVTLSASKITDIRILKGALDKEGKPAELTGGLSMDDLFDNVIKTQSLQVDVISGATLTSKTHLKALENALEQARTK